MIVLEESAHALAANDVSDRMADFRHWFQDLVIESLMRSLPVVMDQEIHCGAAQRRLAEQNPA